MRNYVVVGALALAFAVVGTGCTLAVTQGQRDNIAGKMTGAQPSLAKCYAEALAADPTCRGNVSVNFRVQPNTGRFTNVRVTRTQITQPAFTRCVAAVIGDLYISPGPSFKIDVVDYTIAFTPQP
jgi:hypothetical protein